MKTRLFFSIILFCFLIFLVSSSFAKVIIKGHVYYWNLEEGINATKDTRPEDIEGGRYLPARQLLLEVEFNSPLTIDEQTYTDDSGYYKVTHRNPFTGDWDVDVEVRAEAKLATINGEDIFATCYKGAFDIWPYNGQTGHRSVGDDETITFNVYIGGPQNNIEEWDNDEGGEGRDHLIAFFMCQVILDVFNWLEERAPEREEIKRDTSLFYPASKTRFNAYLSPPGVAWIDIKEGLYYPDEIHDIHDNSKTISQRWRKLRTASLTHEYGHKIMHDVYDHWPEPLEIWEHTSDHRVTSCLYAELGWVEGWAEFFAAAVLDWPTINGEKSEKTNKFEERKKIENIEHVYYPDYRIWQPTGEEFPIIDFECKGNFNWRDEVPNDKRDINEGENASVLWDIYDPKGWEYLPKDQQDSKPAEWPVALKWYDGLEDPNLEHIWKMIAGRREYGPIDVRRQPDCLIDEGDVWEDSFWYYWKNKDDGYGNNTELMHGLKAIMYNRGITSTEYTEHSPEVIIKKVDIENQKIEIEVTEEDSEDQPYLYYNLVYCTGSGENSQANIVFDEDQPLDGDWENNCLSFSIDVFPFYQWKKLIVMVHDSMLCSFAVYENDLYIEGLEIGEIFEMTPYFFLKENSFFKWDSSDKLEVSEDYAYIVSWFKGLGIIDISNPKAPKEVGRYKLHQVHFEDVEIIDRTEELGEKNIFATLACGSSGLEIVNITNPENQINISSLGKVIRGERRGARSRAYAVVSDGGYIYVARSNSGLSIIDISNFDNLFEVTHFAPRPDEELCIDFRDVAVMGHYAYLADSDFGLHIIKVSNPEEQEPERIGFFATFGVIKVVKIFEIEDEDKRNRYALLSGVKDLCDSYKKFLSVIDVTNPENPFEIYTFEYKRADGLSAIAVKGKYVIVAGDKGLCILDIGNSEEFKITPICNQSSTSKWCNKRIIDIAIYEDFIYLLCKDGLYILSIIYR